jgi:hypothetical protein
MKIAGVDSGLDSGFMLGVSGRWPDLPAEFFFNGCLDHLRCTLRVRLYEFRPLRGKPRVRLSPLLLK